MSENDDDWGGAYERAITVDGDSFIEVGVQDPDGHGYHTIRIPFDKDDDPTEYEADVSDARSYLEDHVEGLESRDNNMERWRHWANEVNFG